MILFSFEPPPFLQFYLPPLQVITDILLVTLSFCDILSSSGLPRLYQAAMAGELPLSPVPLLTRTPQDSLAYRKLSRSFQFPPSLPPLKSYKDLAQIYKGPAFPVSGQSCFH